MLTGCANRGTLEGGPKDTTPPKLDTLNSTRNFQTHFQKQTIVLAFEEWVELRDVFNQVVISPPLEHRPKIERRKKTIQVLFDEKEILRDSATYVFNFGNAIVDLTEGNPAPIVFVFSTGAYIDSLSVSGKVVDAFTGKPAEKVLFMLYENLADSVVRKERPFYFSRTDKDGKFQINNVKAGTFKAAALLDQNLNYRYDSDAERIGFLDSALVLKAIEKPELPDTISIDSLTSADSLSEDSLSILPARGPQIAIRLFEEEKPLFLRGKEVNQYGLVKLSFNREPFEARVTYDSFGQGILLEKERDTIRLWYHSPVDTSWNVYVQRDTLIDTVLVKAGLKAAFLQKARLAAASPAGQGQPERLSPQKQYSIRFNHPLDSFDLEKMLLQDSTKASIAPQARIDSTGQRNLQLTSPLKEGTSYKLQLLPGSVTDIFGLANADTISRTFVAGLRKDFGTLTLKVNGLNPELAYVIRLFEKPEASTAVYQVRNSATFSATIPLLPPAVYSVEIIEDLDGNGRWTTGSYDQHRQPERIFRKSFEQLRANWELEAEVEVEFEGMRE